MTGKLTRRAAGALALSSLATLPQAARAQQGRPIRLVVGFAAGGPTDVIARVLGQEMQGLLGQPVVVENRAGANSLIATEGVMRDPPDGQSLLVTTLAHSVNAILLPNARYRPLEDFAPVSLIATLPLIAVTATNSPYANIGALVAAARARPGSVTYGSAGNGGSAHLSAALLAVMTQTEMTHVPFRGNAPALAEVMSGRISFMFYPMVGIAEHIQRGQLRGLAVSTAERHPDFPDVPTMAEAGFGGFERYIQGVGLVAPAETPAPVVERLNNAVRTALAKPELNARLRSLGAVVVGSTPEEFRAFLVADLERWRSLITAARITAEAG
ncbi:MAG: tripartite tricarboxylate transporter substrate binding protein [Alphaproteobacteria bacterium]|jgi:tripartite-type tricarboxylate transporter receptor subunit TctC